MTFDELASITGKSSATLRQLFSRRRWRIREPGDIQAALHYLLRPRQIRRVGHRPAAGHLRAFQFGAPGLSESGWDRYLAAPRFAGAFDPAEKKAAGELASLLVESVPSLVGLILAPENTGWRVLAVQPAALRTRQKKDRLDFAAAGWAESRQARVAVELVTAADFFAWIDRRPERLAELARRAEFGIISVAS